jgi:hypothetical protein
MYVSIAPPPRAIHLERSVSTSYTVYISFECFLPRTNVRTPGPSHVSHVDVQYANAIPRRQLFSPIAPRRSEGQICSRSAKTARRKKPNGRGLSRNVGQLRRQTRMWRHTRNANARKPFSNNNLTSNEGIKSSIRITKTHTSSYTFCILYVPGTVSLSNSD